MKKSATVFGIIFSVLIGFGILSLFSYRPITIASTKASETTAPVIAVSAPIPLAPPKNMFVPVTTTCNNPKALGVSRTLEIDTTDGPGFGFPQFKAYDFLKDHEVVLTFDDGPWPENTKRVLAALQDQCTKAMFFEIGLHISYHPELVKQVIEGGHTVGSHTWSHKDLSKLTLDEAKAEIERAISMQRIAAGVPVSPFFRFPALKMPEDVQKYLAYRHIGMWSADIDSLDFKIHRPDQIIKSIMTKLNKDGKGIILMHDFQKGTSEALPMLLTKLQEGGFKVVQVKAKFPVETLPEYDDWIRTTFRDSVASDKQMDSVIKQIN